MHVGGSKSLRMDARFFEYLHFGLNQTLVKMFSVDNLARSDRKIEQRERSITGRISFVQEKPEGELVLSFPISTIDAIARSLFGAEFQPTDKNRHDVVGEITNVTFGVLKTLLIDDGYRLQMALPRVLIHDEPNKDGAATLETDYISSAGCFRVRLHPSQSAEINAAASVA